MIFTTAWKIKLKISIGLCLIEREDYIEEWVFFFMSVENDYCMQLSVCSGVAMRKSKKTDYHRYSLESKDTEVAGAQYIGQSPKLLVWGLSLIGHIPMLSISDCNPGQWQGKWCLPATPSWIQDGIINGRFGDWPKPYYLLLKDKKYEKKCLARLMSLTIEKHGKK